MRAPKKDVMLAGKYIIPARTTVFLPVRTPCEPASMCPCMGTMAPTLTWTGCCAIVSSCLQAGTSSKDTCALGTSADVLPSA